MGTGGVTLSQDEIRGLLSRADELSRTAGQDLLDRHQPWDRVITALREPDCPRTYLPVLAVLLVARSLRPREELDVLHIQQQTSGLGYAAASIGRLLIPFAVEQSVDLRSRSSQIMNNQPFTFKGRIEPDMSKTSKRAQYREFYSAAQKTNDLESNVALEVLAALFHACRIGTAVEIEEVAIEAGKVELQAIVESTAQFVGAHSDNGRVGQAFVAAVLDVAYDSENVTLGNTADPDASVPGDVQVSRGSVTWLWAEAKQKSVTTGDVESFISKVRSVGGARIIYCALANERYPHNIDPIKIERISDSAGVSVRVFVSPADLLGSTLEMAPGTFSELATRLVNSMINRLDEAGCTLESIDGYRKAIGISRPAD